MLRAKRLLRHRVDSHEVHAVTRNADRPARREAGVGTTYETCHLHDNNAAVAPDRASGVQLVGKARRAGKVNVPVLVGRRRRKHSDVRPRHGVSKIACV
jgi:hypothetical protein